MHILTTGILSGLGRYLNQHFGGLGLHRQNVDQILPTLQKQGIDVILHCAFNATGDIDSDLFLLHKLLSIPHKKFIFISSTDVYPQNGKLHDEDEILSLNEHRSLYSMCKFKAEELVRKHSSNYLIVRPTSLLGSGMKKNSLIKIIEDSPCTITLSHDSKLNYIHYDDVVCFIETALKDDLRGIYNLASFDYMALSEVADMLRKSVTFGDFYYDVGLVNNKKASAIIENFKKPTRQVLYEFIARRYTGGL